MSDSVGFCRLSLECLYKLTRNARKRFLFYTKKGVTYCYEEEV